jgi:KaiC/GvpD/RAD55 family RecA-like ATPase
MNKPQFLKRLNMHYCIMKVFYLLFIQGSAGTGKTTFFARKLTALTRSMGKVALGCTATALAAQVYGEAEEFTTAHDLFGIPVI